MREPAMLSLLNINGIWLTWNALMTLNNEEDEDDGDDDDDDDDDDDYHDCVDIEELWMMVENIATWWAPSTRPSWTNTPFLASRGR